LRPGKSTSWTFCPADAAAFQVRRGLSCTQAATWCLSSGQRKILILIYLTNPNYAFFFKYKNIIYNCWITLKALSAEVPEIQPVVKLQRRLKVWR